MNDRFARYFMIWILALATLWVGERVIRTVLLTEETAPRTTAPRADLGAIEAHTVTLFEKAAPSVVYIFTEERGNPEGGGAGSGFIWDKAGHIVTNFHVVEGSTRVRVRLDSGEAVEARVVGTSPDHDLAVVRLIDSRNLTPIPVGTSADLRVGQAVYAIGNPFGLSRTLTTGIVSALNRRLPTSANREITGVIQTDAAINPGNSGGPLLDSSGRLIGVTTAILSATGSFAGVGFAVPVDAINRIVPSLIRDGRVPRPGIGILAAPDEVATRYGVGGVVVAQVQPGSPAAKAGLRAFDRDLAGLGDVVTHVDGRPVLSVAELAIELERVGVGNKAQLTVLRDGRIRTVPITVADISS